MTIFLQVSKGMGDFVNAMPVRMIRVMPESTVMIPMTPRSLDVDHVRKGIEGMVLIVYLRHVNNDLLHVSRFATSHALFTKPLPYMFT